MNVEEYIIFSVNENGQQGSEVARVMASTYKWGPGNAIQRFVKEKTPKAGLYLVCGPRYDGWVFTMYEVAYPEFAITPKGPRSHSGGEIRLHGSREVTPDAG